MFNFNKIGATYGSQERLRRIAVLLGFAAIAALATIDLQEDIAQGTTLVHVITETVVVIIAIFGTGAMMLRLIADIRSARILTSELQLNLKETEKAAQEWRAEASSLIQGLGASIGQQFERWNLSPAEKEVALFLLKGLTHKEVATMRGISPATARQQAHIIYDKAGVAGRHDLAAFFLEDLALPADSSEPM